jgi:hypothetical protein
MTKINWPLVGSVAVMAGLVVFLYSVRFSHAQEEHHPPQDQALHEKFYSTWMMPDNRAVSCCHNEDCAPAQSKLINSDWYARKSDNEDWVLIPSRKIERDRDTPDGRSHLCGRRYGFTGGEFSVFCFIAGSGS